MTNVDAVNGQTARRLLDTLRAATRSTDLEFAMSPAPLSGGFYAEMFRFRLANPPTSLDRDLVARIVPTPAAGAWEATIQTAVADQGFPTPAVRLTADETGPLGRYLIVMDALDGKPPIAGLGIGAIAARIPNFVRRLPEQLAGIAAALHSLDPEPVTSRLAALDVPFPLTTADFVEEQAGLAEALGHLDIAEAGKRLLDTEPPSPARVITHGDLHPFNLIISPGGASLVDWTVARAAHPAFTVSFTELMLANPPVSAPKATAFLGPIGRKMARRFLAIYRDLTEGTISAVDQENLDWHRKVHALRILVETAGWDADGAWPTSGHPWLILEPVARNELGLDRA